MFRIKSGQILLVMFVGVILLSGSVSAEKTEPACHIELSADPADTLRVTESGEGVLTVSATFYYYIAREVNLYVNSLPDFIQGWDSVSENCSNCTVSDELTVSPGPCDRGTYRIVFRAEAGDVYDELVFYVVVEPAAAEGEMLAPAELSGCVGEELEFQVCFLPDPGCPEDDDPVWSVEGYPLLRGADINAFEDDPQCRDFRWVPSYADTGTHLITFTVLYGDFSYSAVVDLSVSYCGCLEERVEIIDEPEFSRGTSNEICYRPECSAYDHDIYYFDRDNMAPSGKLLMNTALDSPDRKCENKSDLRDGVTYGFYVTAYFSDVGDTLVSDTTYTTQDASPPAPVSTLTAEADSGGVVRLGWYGVADEVSGVEYYEIIRSKADTEKRLIATVASDPENSPEIYYRYTDSIAGGSGLVEGEVYRYEVRAVDRVGLKGESDITGPVVPDATPPCVPAVEVFNDIIGGYSDRFAYKEGVNGVARGRSGCGGLAAAHFIQFECVRDSMKFFGSQWMPGSKFFRSGWIECDSAWVENSFDLLAPGRDSSFVNDHIYLFRTRAKDSVGNISEFSCSELRPHNCDTLGMDVFPPADVLNLVVTPGMTDDSEAYFMNLDWEGAADRESGLKSYRIYRKFSGSEFRTVAVDVPGTSFRDSLAEGDFLSGEECCYFVGSIDRVGNIRNYHFPESGDYICARVPVGPEIYPVCDLSRDGRCFVREDTVLVNIDEDYNNSYINCYIIECGGDTINYFDTASYRLEVPLPREGEYSLRIRAEFNDGLRSTWSSPVLLTRDSSPSEPVVSLSAVSTSEECIGYLLSWSEPNDEITTVAGYRVWKSGPEDESVLVAETPDTFACIPFDNDTTYRYYHFTVNPVDLLGNTRVEGNNAAETYCARAPVIQCNNTPLRENKCITVDWSAAEPSSGEELKYRMRIVSEEAGVDSIISGIGDTDMVYCAYSSGYYSFRVREIAEEKGLETQWSERCVIPFREKPPAVSDFTIQPQPLSPGAGTQSGVIDLHWKYNSLPGIVEYFRIERSRGSEPEETMLISYSPPDSIYSLRDDSLEVDRIYSYTIKAVDHSGQGAELDTCGGGVSPAWVYTPRAKSDGRGDLYFRGDTLRVEWEWTGPDCEISMSDYGAAHCKVQIGSSPDFEQVCESGWLPAGQSAADVDVESLLGPSVNELYCRIKGRDYWGNESPWSDQYEGCFETQPLRGLRDENPPWPIEHLSVYSVKADSSSAPDSVDVFLSWSRALDVSPGSGLDCYRVYRSLPGGRVKYLLTTTDTFAVDQNIHAVEANSCLYRYTVHPVDRLGNEQKYNNDTECLEILPSPDTLRAESRRSIVWGYPESEPVDGFIAECSNYRSYLGTDLIKFLEDEAVAVIDDPNTREFTFNTTSDFVQSDTVFFHIKAFRGDYESAWSEVIQYPYQDGEVRVSHEHEKSPRGFQLYQNQPNPFNPITTINFDIAESGHVKLVIYDVRGRTVRELIDGHKARGCYSIPWDGKNAVNGMAASGMYFYRLRAGGYTETRKMILLR